MNEDKTPSYYIIKSFLKGTNRPIYVCEIAFTVHEQYATKFYSYELAVKEVSIRKETEQINWEIIAIYN